MIVKRFTTERAAQIWAWQFAYARRRSRLTPLMVVRAGNQWGVDNPDYSDGVFVLDARGRVERMACATTLTGVDTSSFTTGPAGVTSPDRADSSAVQRQAQNTPHRYLFARGPEA